MPRNEVIEFKVTAEEKESIRSQAKHLGVAVGAFARAAALREHLDVVPKLPAQETPAQEPETDDELGEGTYDEEDWVKRRALQLTARMGSRKARIEAQKEWEEMG